MNQILFPNPTNARTCLIFTARQQSCGKVMLSVVSVCHSVHRGYHKAIGPHHAGTLLWACKLVQLRPYCTVLPPYKYPPLYGYP